MVKAAVQNFGRGFWVGRGREVTFSKLWNCPFSVTSLLFEQAPDLRHPLVEADNRLVERNTEALIFVRQKGAGEAHLEPPAGDRIQHADLAGQLERVVEHRQHRPGHHARGPAALRGGGQEDDRVGAVAAVSVEVVLDRADVGVAVLVAQLAQL